MYRVTSYIRSDHPHASGRAFDIVPDGLDAKDHNATVKYLAIAKLFNDSLPSDYSLLVKNPFRRNDNDAHQCWHYHIVRNGNQRGFENSVLKNGECATTSVINYTKDKFSKDLEIIYVYYASKGYEVDFNSIDAIYNADNYYTQLQMSQENYKNLRHEIKTMTNLMQKRDKFDIPKKYYTTPLESYLKDLKNDVSQSFQSTFTPSALIMIAILIFFLIKKR